MRGEDRRQLGFCSEGPERPEGVRLIRRTIRSHRKFWSRRWM